MIIHYDIEYWDEVEKDTMQDSGIVGAGTLGDGVERVCEYYGGAENVCSIKIYQCEDVLSIDDIKDMVDK